MAADSLRIDDLRVYFYTTRGTVRAVDGVTMKVGEKETVGLVGESGCGKSTVAFAIMKVVQPPGKIIGGRILYNNRNLLELSDEELRSVRGKKISIVFQDPMTYLNPVMKAGDQIAENIRLHERRKKSDIKKSVIKLLGTVGLHSPSKVASSYPFELSGGMRQRVLIATAISCNPSLLIADEITTALDVIVQRQILDLIVELKTRLGMSMLLITHDLGIVAETCDKVYIMYAGKIVEYADVDELYENPLHLYTQGLLKSTLSIDEFKENLVSVEGTVPNLIDPPSGCRFHPRCIQAKPICHEQEPPIIEVRSNHGVACWQQN